MRAIKWAPQKFVYTKPKRLCGDVPVPVPGKVESVHRSEFESKFYTQTWWHATPDTSNPRATSGAIASSTASCFLDEITSFAPEKNRMSSACE